MILLGYAAMLMLGLMPLAAVARMTGAEAERVFFLPTMWALVAAFALGVLVCGIIGRVLGLLTLTSIETYEDRRAIEAKSRAASRRRSVARHRIRSAATPFARF